MKICRLLVAIIVFLPCLYAEGEKIAGDVDDRHIHIIQNLQVGDWKTLGLLCNLKAPKVHIEAKTAEELIQELEKISRGIDGAENIRFTMPKSITNAEVEVALTVRNVPLACLIEYLCSASHTRAVIKENEVVFIPVIG